MLQEHDWLYEDTLEALRMFSEAGVFSEGMDVCTFPFKDYRDVFGGPRVFVILPLLK